MFFNIKKMRETTSFHILLSLAITGGVACFASDLTPAKGQMIFRIERAGYPEFSDHTYAPYTAWWVEDSEGNRLKTIYLSFYSDDAGVETCGKTGYLYTLTYYFRRIGCPGIDAVTGASESNSSTAATTVVHTWDMVDLLGDTLTSGAINFFFNIVVFDEELGESDKVWQVGFALRPVGFDTTLVNPSELDIGHGTFSEPKILKIDIAYGGTLKSASSDTAKIAEKMFPNVAPLPPTAAMPAQRDFCGRGGPSAAIFLAFCLKACNRRKKKNV